MRSLCATITLFTSLLLSTASAEKREVATVSHTAVIVLEGTSRNGIAHNEAISITNKHTLKRLEGFFPGFERSPSSRQAAGWKRGYRVYFHLPDGKCLLVTVSENGGGHIWAMGKGDLRTRGDFKGFVDGLRKEKGLEKITTPQIIKILETGDLVHISTRHDQSIEIKLNDGSVYHGKYVQPADGPYAKDKHLSDIFNLVRHITDFRDDLDNFESMSAE